MDKTKTSKARLALVAALAISLSAPAYAAPPAHGRYGGGASHGYRGPAQHHSSSGAGAALLITALFGLTALAVATSGPPVPVQPAVVPVYPPSAPVAQAPQPAYWYYCQDSNTYYPYVQQCAGGWQQVTPQPPAPPR